jgi:hypothetical protein
MPRQVECPTRLPQLWFDFDGVAHILIWWPVDGMAKDTPEIVGREPTERANDVLDSFPLPPFIAAD